MQAYTAYLIVAKQREVNTSNDCYGDVELRAREPVESLHGETVDAVAWTREYSWMWI